MVDTTEHIAEHLENLAAYRHCTERIQNAWPDFLTEREQRLRQQRRLGEACEKVAENILEDLFTAVLDWPLADFNNQVEHADIVLTEHGIKRLVVEVKRPGSLAWSRKAVESALDQALRYAAEQRVKAVAISDGLMLYAADIADGGLRDRIFVSLAENQLPLDLWWMAVQGIWREREFNQGARLRLLPEEPVSAEHDAPPTDMPAPLLHPKYHLPALRLRERLLEAAVVEVPYLLADGAVDAKRLPKAIQAILSNYRGVKVSGIPEDAIPAVLQRLARAARQAGHIPPEACNPAPIYRRLADALEQLGGEASAGS
jgi:hypothetical protein